jgi:hypothetical protein
MDDYPYATLGVDGWLRCDGLHRPGFLTLFWDVLHYFGHTGTPAYRGCSYRELRRGRCEVHVDVLAHPSNPGMTAWFTTATNDDLDDTLERAAPRPSRSSMSATCQAGTTIALRMRAIQRGVSAWPLWVTPSIWRTTRGGHSRHAMPSTQAPCSSRSRRLVPTSAYA